MKRIFALFLCMTILLTGCSSSSSNSYTFDVSVNAAETVAVKVTLDTSNGYTLLQADNQFAVYDSDGVPLSYGFFMNEDGYKFYQDLAYDIATYRDVTVGNSDGFYYTASADGMVDTEWDYILHVTGTNVYIGVANAISAESADAVVNALTFSEG